jgi:hypothetical protein
MITLPDIKTNYKTTIMGKCCFNATFEKQISEEE